MLSAGFVPGRILSGDGIFSSSVDGTEKGVFLSLTLFHLFLKSSVMDFLLETNTLTLATLRLPLNPLGVISRELYLLEDIKKIFCENSDMYDCKIGVYYIQDYYQFPKKKLDD